MKKILENTGIVLGISIVLGLMFTGSLAFAEPKVNTNKSYYVEKTENLNYTQSDIELTTKLTKKVETKKSSTEYSVEIDNGNVVLKNVNTGKNLKVYKKGDAKYLAQVDYHFYDTQYILIITDKGAVYANVYPNSSYDVKFRKIKMNMKVDKLMVRETNKRFYEYPIVSLFGIDKDGNWEAIKL